jgi:hypothetical protein
VNEGHLRFTRAAFAGAEALCGQRFSGTGFGFGFGFGKRYM